MTRILSETRTREFTLTQKRRTMRREMSASARFRNLCRRGAIYPLSERPVDSDARRGDVRDANAYQVDRDHTAAHCRDIQCVLPSSARIQLPSECGHRFNACRDRASGCRKAGIGLRSVTEAGARSRTTEAATLFAAGGDVRGDCGFFDRKASKFCA